MFHRTQFSENVPYPDETKPPSIVHAVLQQRLSGYRVDFMRGVDSMSADKLVEEIASLVLMADVSDRSSLERLAAGFERLEGVLSSGDEHHVLPPVQEILSRLRGLLGGESEDRNMDLEWIVSSVTAIQQALRRTSASGFIGGRTSSAEPSSDRFVLPELVEPSTFQEFLSAQAATLDEIEEDILAFEKGRPDSLAALRRRIHTMKGEAGVLGLDDLMEVCHALEDFLDLPLPAAERVDRLLEARDWIGRAMDAYGRNRLPEPRAARVILRLRSGAAGGTGGSADGSPVLDLENRPAVSDGDESERVLRTGDTPALTGKVVQEAAGEAARAAEILQEAKQRGADPEMVKDLLGALAALREGVEVFPDFLEMADMARTAETLLSCAHDGGLGLDDTVLGPLLDAVEQVQDALARIFIAVEEGEPFPPVQGLAVLRDRMQDAMKNRPVLPAGPAGSLSGDGGRACVEDVDIPRHVEREPETVSLVSEFVQESGDALDRADEILLEAERRPADPEMVNGLFRVFHTIKGVAGFLDLREVADLAHTTETLLNRVREGGLQLAGPVLNLVFDATEMMRGMIAGIRRALEQGTVFPSVPGLQALLETIKSAIAGNLPLEPDPPRFPPDARLGEVIREIASVPPEKIERALRTQKKTGQRLGEVLIAEGLVRPKDVGKALRAQSQARDAVTGPAKIKETVKVDLDRVDNLVAMIGELVIVESMVVHAPEISALSSTRVRKSLAQLANITRELQDIGMRMRMVPVRSVFQKMARMVRDLSRKSGKQVELEVSGEGTEMDRSMVEQINDPLVHMIRNAVDHGIESPEERRKSGKPPKGSVRLSAYHEGGGIVIEIKDDGRGLDREAILKKAQEKGLAGERDNLSEREIYNLIFAPGFSTAKEVTEVSGRGVGMDVVRRNIEKMRGRVQISSTPGKGSSFKMVLPLTLAIIDGMLVACGEDRYLIPTLSIVESVQPKADMLLSVADRRELINIRGEVMPLLRLNRLLQIRTAKADPTQGLAVVIESGGRKVALLVDEVITQQQVVIKNFESKAIDIRVFSGAAILSDGTVGLILNPDEIADLLDAGSARVHETGGGPPGGAITTTTGAPYTPMNQEVRI